MLEKGALLFKFVQPDAGSRKKEHILWFEQMQELGFLVTTRGCILPYENFSGSSKGRPKGHKISALFFKGEAPTFPEHRYGWPVSTQVSHLCHRKSCINPNHLVYEPQWTNLKRNYCGNSGSCDCGMNPKCILPYHNDVWKYEDKFLTYNSEGLNGAIRTHLSGLRYRILPKDYYRSVDNKREQRNKRLQAKRKSPPTKESNVKKKAK